MNAKRVLPFPNSPRPSQLFGWFGGGLAGGGPFGGFGGLGGFLGGMRELGGVGGFAGFSGCGFFFM